ncbi:MAG: IS66 family insertion sequence element accessory protein TnpB [Deferribacteres bacterium]|nr:IS66 family insertion sequence element accessory protein TnpB [Deferribacteres bacterium]
MFAAPARLKFYLYREPADMRKGFDGLCGLVTDTLGADPLSGDVFIFLNRRRNRMKLLLWDRDGFWIFYKRLEQGAFEPPVVAEKTGSVELAYDELMLILHGIELASAKRRRRYRPAA